MQKLLDEIQTHPLVVAIVVFVLVFIVYNVMKKPGSTIGASNTGTGIQGATAGYGASSGGSEVYASQNYQYPTYNAPVVQQQAPPVTTSTGSTTPAQASKTNYFGILSVTGSEHPANIGPWIAGRQVNYAGNTYTLDPGNNGYLWGTEKSSGQKVLLWNGNDWGPLGGSYGQHLLASTGAI